MNLVLIYAFEEFHYLVRRNFISNPVLFSYFLVFSIVFWIFPLSISVLYFMFFILYNIFIWFCCAPLIFFFFFCWILPLFTLSWYSDSWTFLQCKQFRIRGKISTFLFSFYVFVFSFVFRFPFYILLFCRFSPLHLVNIILHYFLFFTFCNK